MTSQQVCKRFAPWRDIMMTPGYHGDISEESVEELLTSKDFRSFIVTNYNPNLEKLVLSSSCIESHLCEQRAVIRTRPYTMSCTVYNKRDCHPMCNFYHPHRCLLLYCLPVRNKTPFSLAQWARATVCANYSFEDMENLMDKKQLPKAVFDFLAQNHMSIANGNHQNGRCNKTINAKPMLQLVAALKPYPIV